VRIDRSRNFQGGIHPSAGGNKYGGIPLIFQGLQGKILTPLLTELDGYTQTQDGVDFVVENIPGDSKLKKAITQCSAQLRR